MGQLSCFFTSLDNWCFEINRVIKREEALRLLKSECLTIEVSSYKVNLSYYITYGKIPGF